MNKRFQNHLLFWIIYVVLKTSLNISVDETITWTYLVDLILMQSIFLLVKIPLVYFFFYITDRYFYGQWRIGIVIATLGLGFIASIVMMTFLNHNVVLPLIFERETHLSLFAPSSLIYHSFTLSFVIGITLAIRLFRREYKHKLHEAELIHEKKESELKYLKSQINPHFLFNTLNNIYSLARKGSEHTAESVLKLSALMRFMLYEASNKDILLTDELRIIEDYIELEKLRYSDRLRVNIQKDIDDDLKRIAPLLLIHFVENAFKHGASESRKQIEINISITLKNSVLTAKFDNPLVINASTETKEHIGMRNIQRQLNLLYPNHTLNVDKTIDRYSVILTMQI